MKVKDKLLLFLALNTLSTSLTETTPKYDSLYNKMTKNLETGKSNESSYKLLEKILKQRNKELKDLYIQNDYIVKPEFLEWQVFFTGFYDSNNKGKKNDSDIEIISESTGKKISMEKILLLSKNPREDINLNLSGIEVPVMNDFNYDIGIRQIEDKVINIEEIEFNNLKYINYYLSDGSYSLTSATGTSTRNIGYNTTGNMLYENVNLESEGTTISWDGDTDVIELKGESRYFNGLLDSKTALSEIHTSVTNPELAINNISLDGDFTIKGKWNFDFIGSNKDLSFLAYRPEYLTKSGSVTFDGDLTLTNKLGKYVKYNQILGLALIGDSGTSDTVKLINNGNIYLKSESMIDYSYSVLVGMYGKLNSGTGELINNGTIYVDIPQGENFVLGPGRGMGIIVYPSLLGTLNVEAGKIVVTQNANDGVGLLITTAVNDYGITYSNTKVKNGSIDLLSPGVALGINAVISNSTAENPIDGISNISIYMNAEGEVSGNTNPPATRGIGVVLAVRTSHINKVPVLNDGIISKIVVGPKTKGGVIIESRLGSSIIDKSLGDVIENNAGEYNMVLYNSPSIYGSFMTNYMDINIGSGAKGGIGIFSREILNNYGDIVINSSNDGSVTSTIGMVVNEGINEGNVTLNTDNGIGLMGQTITSRKGNIIVNGDNGITIYPTGLTYSGSRKLNIVSGNLELHGKNGRLIYNGQNSIGVKLGTIGNNMNAIVDGKYSHFIFTDKSLVKTEIIGTLNTDIKNGGFGFNYSNASNSSLTPTDYLGSILDLSTGVLNMNLDSNSYLFNIQNSNLTLSAIENTGLAGLNIIGSKKSYITNSSLILDIDSNLDINNNTGNKLYRESKVYGTNITINPNISVIGTEDNQTGIGPGSKKLIYINNGIINLSGNNSMGIYGNNIKSVNNNGYINIEGGDGNVGIYSTITESYINTSIENTQEIKIGSNGVGIYGVTSSGLSGSVLNIDNTGKIIGTGDKVTGIYVNNVDGTGRLRLGSNSNINFENTTHGIGIYTNNYNVNEYSSSGTISVGKDGVGIYSNNGNSYFSGLTLNLKGENAVGIYTDGSNSFIGFGTINVENNGAVVFNILGDYFYDGFNVISTPGLTYTLANLKNNSFASDKHAELGKGSVYINGEDSTIVLGRYSKLTSSESDLIGLAAKGKSMNLPTYLSTIYDYYYVENEATNFGIIDFGNKSTGIYVSEGASGENQGEISLGNRSVGIYGAGAGSRIINNNSGSLIIGEESRGLFLKDGMSIENKGTISGDKDKIIGVYSETSVSSTLDNDGIIDLSGNNTIGIYTSGSGMNIVNNTGDIIVGDSTSKSDVSIGIYGNSSHDIINNTGSIRSGKESIGIYNKHGIINNTSGNIEIEEKGVGIYSESGEVNLLSGNLVFNGVDSIGIYGKNETKIDNNLVLELTDDSYGIMLNSGSSLINRNYSTIKERGVFLYSKGDNDVINESNANINMLGSNSVGFFMEDGGNLVNKALIEGDKGTGNIGIYVKGGSINNNGDIKLGDSVILSNEDLTKNLYSVGIYGEGLKQLNNTGNIEVGSEGIGIFSVESEVEVINKGNINSNSDGAKGIYLIKSQMKNEGNIILSGNNSVGIGITLGSTIKNAGSVTINGNNSIGIYANAGSKVINEETGKIYINGNNSTGIQLSGNSVLENYGLIEVGSGTINSDKIKYSETDYKIPSIINAGVIKVDEKFEMNGIDLIIKPDPASFRKPTIEEITKEGYDLEDINSGFLVSNSVSVKAPSFEAGTDSVKIDPLFTQGTNARVYKFENVFDPATPEGGFNEGDLTIKSNSLTFDAIPVINKSGKVDIWMEKIDYNKFTQGTWQNEFAENIEKKYLNAEGEALKLYDKLDLITEKSELNRRFDQLAGNIYSNMNEREKTIADTFESSLSILENSKNNTKENVKINVIAGKGNVKEETSGVVNYDFTTTGVMALREVERTYKHKFAYSLGYQHTTFDFDDGNKSKELADSIQLGFHNNYGSDGWKLKNDITGRVSIYNIDRNIEWDKENITKLDGHYETYSITSNNTFGKELSLGKNASITPYGGVKASYIIRPSFSEKGAEGLEIKGNDALSIKPKIGLELEGSLVLGAKDKWRLKGNLDMGYEYELSGINKEEKGKLSLLEDDYHKLAKPENENGTLRTKVMVGVEAEERYGMYLTGEYGTDMDDKEDYRIGLNLKASF